MGVIRNLLEIVLQVSMGFVIEFHTRHL